MPDVTAPLRKAIIRVFTRKYNLQLHASALGFIADVFYQHGMLHSPQDWEEGLEHLAKQYIDSEHYSGTTTAGAMAAASSSSSSLVTAEALEAVYQKMILADTNGHSSSVAGPSSSSRRDLHHDEDSLEDSSYVHHTILEHEKVDPNRHFQVIDAFQLPRTRWDPARKTFEIAPRGSVLPLAVARPNTLRERLSLVKSIVLRNENFLPPLAVGRGKERNAFMKITSIKNLAGRQGERFLLLGLLCTLHDGRYALEDGDGSVLLDLKHAAAGEGIFTEGAIVLVSGEYLHNETFRVDDMGQPPSERRSEARSMYGHIDFLGTGATTAKEEKVLREYEKQHEDLTMAVLSDFAIDNPKTLASFRTILQGCVDSGFVPFVFVLCGDFCADGARSGGDTMRRYTGEWWHAVRSLLNSGDSAHSVNAPDRGLLAPGRCPRRLPDPAPLLPLRLRPRAARPVPVQHDPQAAPARDRHAEAARPRAGAGALYEQPVPPALLQPGDRHQPLGPDGQDAAQRRLYENYGPRQQ